jgi:chorismate mutase / prephenate dehydratase
MARSGCHAVSGRADEPGDDGALAVLRARIDALDDQLLALASERARLALEVAAVKRARGESDFYRPEREAEVLRRLGAQNPGPLPSGAVQALFRELMSACRALEAPLRVAYLGPEGTFSQEAVARHFGQGVAGVPLPGIPEVFREIESGAAHHAVVPVENSTEGGVTPTLDLLTRTTVSICGEVELPIHQCLMAGGGTLAEVRRVVSHPQSLAQCRRALERLLPGIATEAVASNAEAARFAAERPGTAALAGRSAAQRYGLVLLAENIEDEPGNTTRFLVLGRTATRPSGRDKTSLLVELGAPAATRAGALLDLLEPLRAQGVSMTRIESRPARRGRWEYVFFMDLQGHAEDAPVAAALEALRAIAARVTVLGSYPRAVAVAS